MSQKKKKKDNVYTASLEELVWGPLMFFLDIAIALSNDSLNCIFVFMYFGTQGLILARQALLQLEPLHQPSFVMSIFEIGS
jgi:hypothetical protein